MIFRNFRRQTAQKRRQKPGQQPDQTGPLGHPHQPQPQRQHRHQAQSNLERGFGRVEQGREQTLKNLDLAEHQRLITSTEISGNK